tara:strand:+ start:82 stop:369 length:288 start_codon:yes stop_codon:yes gene_type:complete
MSILDQQGKMSLAMTSGRSIEGQAGAEWVSRNITDSQLRTSDTNSDLVSGYHPGGDRDPYMYPDNRTTMASDGTIDSDGDGTEFIKVSNTAAQLG